MGPDTGEGAGRHPGRHRVRLELPRAAHGEPFLSRLPSAPHPSGLPLGRAVAWAPLGGAGGGAGPDLGSVTCLGAPQRANCRPSVAASAWRTAASPCGLPTGAPHVKDGVDVFFPVPAPTCWCGPCPVCAVGRRHVNVWGAEGSTRGHLTRELRPSGWRGDPRRDISPQSREMEKKVLNSTVGFTACARTRLSCVDARTYMTF